MRTEVDINSLQSIADDLEHLGTKLTRFTKEAIKRGNEEEYFGGPRVRSLSYTEDGPSVGSKWVEVGSEEEILVVTSVDEDEVWYTNGKFDALGVFKKSVQKGKYCLVAEASANPPAEDVGDESTEAASKVIVVLDNDGHVGVWPQTLSNMKKLLYAVLEGNDFNTILDDPDKGHKLIQKKGVTLQQIEDYLNQDGPTGRSRGNLINFVSLGKDKIEASLFE